MSFTLPYVSVISKTYLYTQAMLTWDNFSIGALKNVNFVIFIISSFHLRSYTYIHTHTEKRTDKTVEEKREEKKREETSL